MNPHKDEGERFEKWHRANFNFTSEWFPQENRYYFGDTQTRWEAWQAALSAEPTAPQPRTCAINIVTDLYYAQKDGCKKHQPGVGKICLGCVEDALTAAFGGDSEKEGGTAKCEKCGATERDWMQEGVYPICTTGGLHPWVGSRALLAGSAANSSTSMTTRNSAEATAIPATSASTPAGTAERSSASDAPAPVSVEELAREIVGLVHQYNHPDTGIDDDVIPEIAALLRSRLGERP